MLGKRANMEGAIPQSEILEQNPVERRELIQNGMLSIGQTNSLEFLIMKYFVDYEFPETQGYVKGFWKDMLFKTYSEIFHCSTS